MGWDSSLTLLVLTEVSDLDMSLLGVRDGQNGDICIGVKCAKSLWVVAGIEAVDQCQVGKVVHIDLHLKHNHNLVFSELHSLNFTAK